MIDPAVIHGVSRADGYSAHPVTGRRGHVPPELAPYVRVERALVFLAAAVRQRLEESARDRGVPRLRHWALWLRADEHVQDAIERLEDAKTLAAARLGLLPEAP